MRGCMSPGALGLLLLPQRFGPCPLCVGRCAVLWDATVDKNLCCAPMAAMGSALKRDQHPSIRKGPMAGGLQGERVSGHELEKLGILGVQGA